MGASLRERERQKPQEKGKSGSLLTRMKRRGAVGGRGGVRAHQQREGGNMRPNAMERGEKRIVEQEEGKKATGRF